MSTGQLDLIERKAFYQGSLPTLILLKEWQHGIHATVKVLLDALEDIGNHSAVLLMRDWLQETEAALLLISLRHKL